MSIDVTFEELEKTAFEFAKAMGAGTGASLSLDAMKLAEKWHAESALRQSLYNAKRATWEETDSAFDYSTSDFVVDHPYWVITQPSNQAVQAYFSKYSSDNGSTQPMFSEDTNGFSCFAVSHYIKKEEGDKISAKTPPPLPKGVKKKPVRNPPIPTMANHWQSN